MSARSSLALAALLALVSLPTLRADDPAPQPRGFVGIQMIPIPQIPAEQRKQMGITREQGVLIFRVTKGTPAAKAGLKPGDILVKLNGRAIPDTSAVTADDKATQEAWGKRMNEIGETIKVGAEVEVVVNREGADVVLKAVAINADEMKRLSAAAAEEEGEEKEGKEEHEGDEEDELPPLKDAGEPTPFTEDFEKIPAGKPAPVGFHGVEGKWEVVAAQDFLPAEVKTNHALRQGKTVDTWAVGLLAGPGRAYSDASVTVRFLPVSGQVDASGGIVFRAKDAQNYYLVRANALENNFRLYKVVDGGRRELKSVDVALPKMGAWHTLEVTFKGKEIHATLNGTVSIDAVDDAFSSGWTGLWTKADSVTLFDDWKVVPALPTR